jgi:hypothetical protein
MAVHVNCIFKFKRCTKYIGHVSHNSYKNIAFQNDTNEEPQGLWSPSPGVHRLTDWNLVAQF